LVLLHNQIIPVYYALMRVWQLRVRIRRVLPPFSSADIQHKEDLMNKTELISAVAEATGHTKVDCATIVGAAIDAVGASLASGEDVSLLGFGRFTAKDRPAREARNPITGKKVSVPAKRVPRFIPGKELRAVVDHKPKVKVKK
jgi:nucleoid DNA-binding protein